MLAKPGALVRGAERNHGGELATVYSKLRGRVIGLKNDVLTITCGSICCYEPKQPNLNKGCSIQMSYYCWGLCCGVFSITGLES